MNDEKLRKGKNQRKIVRGMREGEKYRRKYTKSENREKGGDGFRKIRWIGLVLT